MLANECGSREETCCGETNMPNSSLPSESKCSQRSLAQQKQQMREVIQHQVLSVAKTTYCGTDMYTEYTYVYVYWGTIYFIACCKSTVFIFCTRSFAEYFYNYLNSSFKNTFIDSHIFFIAIGVFCLRVFWNVFSLHSLCCDMRFL